MCLKLGTVVSCLTFCCLSCTTGAPTLVERQNSNAVYRGLLLNCWFESFALQYLLGSNKKLPLGV